MKFMIAFSLLTSISASSFAGCIVEYNQPRDRAYSLTVVNEKANAKIVKMMEAKGYTLKSSKELEGQVADYSLEVMGTYGFGCANGLTASDYISIPTSYSVKFAIVDGNTILEKEDEGKRFILAPKASMVRGKILKAIKEIPECK